MATSGKATAAVEEQGFRLSLRMVAIGLVLLAVVVSGYLAYSTYTDTATACIDTGNFDCETVQNHSSSRLMGIPIAYLGFATNLGLLALLLLEDRIPFLQTFGVTIFFGIVLFGFLYSMYLVYLQVAVIESFCQWCLTHEAIVTVLFVVALLRLRQHMATVE